MFVNLDLHERAVIMRKGAPVRALEPGIHSFWRHYQVFRWDTNLPTFTAPAPVLAGVPSAWYETVQLEVHQRAVVSRDGRPVKFLRPGVHRLWRIDPNVTLQVFAVTDPAPELTDKVIAENPVLMRLKELETMKDIAEKIDEIKLVMGVDGLKGFLPLASGKADN